MWNVLFLGCAAAKLCEKKVKNRREIMSLSLKYVVRFHANGPNIVGTVPLVISHTIFTQLYGKAL
jgi:hypothetical protein